MLVLGLRLITLIIALLVANRLMVWVWGLLTLMLIIWQALGHWKLRILFKVLFHDIGCLHSLSLNALGIHSKLGNFQSIFRQSVLHVWWNFDKVGINTGWIVTNSICCWESVIASIWVTFAKNIVCDPSACFITSHLWVFSILNSLEVIHDVLFILF